MHSACLISNLVQEDKETHPFQATLQRAACGGLKPPCGDGALKQSERCRANAPLTSWCYTKGHCVYADVCSQLQDAQHSQHELQSGLQSAQSQAQSLQTRLDAATKAKQEAEALCIHLGEELRSLQGRLTGSQHSMTLFQTQQLEMQVGMHLDIATASLSISAVPTGTMCQYK